MTRAFVFTNHKGGVGKSGSATNTALGIVNALRRANAPHPRVLIIDTDSQAHASLVTTGRKAYIQVVAVLVRSLSEGGE